MHRVARNWSYISMDFLKRVTYNPYGEVRADFTVPDNRRFWLRDFSFPTIHYPKFQSISRAYRCGDPPLYRRISSSRNSEMFLRAASSMVWRPGCETNVRSSLRLDILAGHDRPFPPPSHVRARANTRVAGELLRHLITRNYEAILPLLVNTRGTERIGGARSVFSGAGASSWRSCRAGTQNSARLAENLFNH